MKQNAFITTTAKWHYILLTEKRRITIYTIAAFLRKMTETQKLPPEKAEAIMQDRAALAEMRKRIEPCTYEITGETPYHHIEVGNPERPHAILNYPLEEKCVIIFSEGKAAKPIIRELYEEA